MEGGNRLRVGDWELEMSMFFGVERGACRDELARWGVTHLMLPGWFRTSTAKVLHGLAEIRDEMLLVLVSQ